MNECDFELNATRNTASTPFSADLTVKCPTGGKPIEVHVYNSATKHESVLCTYDIFHQTVNNAIQLTNEGRRQTRRRPRACQPGSRGAEYNSKRGMWHNTFEKAKYEGTVTLRATNKAGAFVIRQSAKQAEQFRSPLTQYRAPGIPGRSVVYRPPF